MRFEVKRSEWFRGHGERSALFVLDGDRPPEFPDRKRCCLGFFANACGISDADLESIPSPGSVACCPTENKTAWAELTEPSVQTRVNSVQCCQIMKCNDSNMSDGIIERELTDLFAQIGHDIVFVD